jgi:hypothetical protein
MQPGARLAAITFALMVLAAAAWAQEFRATSWLMSRQEVMASEAGRAVSEVDLTDHQKQIVFQSYLAGFSVTITYLLQNDELMSASYTFRRDRDRAAFDFMRSDLQSKNGAPSFDKQDLVGWRLPKTEIALAHLKDGSTYVAYWEKSYFARLNSLPASGR